MDSGNSPLVEIDGYELLEELGRGGTSIVYRARAPDSSLVAFKLFTKRALREETFLNRLEREVAISRTFSHPLLNRLVGHGVTADKAPYIVVELLEGKILRDIMRPGPLRLPNVISLIDNICQAMAGRLPAGSSGYRRVGPGDECLRSVWGLPPPRCSWATRFSPSG